jgi:hypothetical protein
MMASFTQIFNETARWFAGAGDWAPQPSAVDIVMPKCIYPWCSNSNIDVEARATLTFEPS